MTLTARTGTWCHNAAGTSSRWAPDTRTSVRIMFATASGFGGPEHRRQQGWPQVRWNQWNARSHTRPERTGGLPPPWRRALCRAPSGPRIGTLPYRIRLWQDDQPAIRQHRAPPGDHVTFASHDSVGSIPHLKPRREARAKTRRPNKTVARAVRKRDPQGRWCPRIAMEHHAVRKRDPRTRHRHAVRRRKEGRQRMLAWAEERRARRG